MSNSSTGRIETTTDAPEIIGAGYEKPQLAIKYIFSTFPQILWKTLKASIAKTFIPVNSPHIK